MHLAPTRRPEGAVGRDGLKQVSGCNDCLPFSTCPTPFSPILHSSWRQSANTLAKLFSGDAESEDKLKVLNVAEQWGRALPIPQPRLPTLSLTPARAPFARGLRLCISLRDDPSTPISTWPAPSSLRERMLPQRSLSRPPRCAQVPQTYIITEPCAPLQSIRAQVNMKRVLHTPGCL